MLYESTLDLRSFMVQFLVDQYFVNLFDCQVPRNTERRTRRNASSTRNVLLSASVKVPSSTAAVVDSLSCLESFRRTPPKCKQ